MRAATAGRWRPRRRQRGDLGAVSDVGVSEVAGRRFSEQKENI